MTAPKLISAFLLITFTTLGVDAAEPGTVDNVGQNPATAAKLDTLSSPDTKIGYLIKEAAFREFFKSGKDKLKLFGQKLTAVFSNYPEIPS